MPTAQPRRRGRPPEFVDDGTPPGARHGGAPQRVAWLLRRCRLHLRRGRFARQREFVQALTDIGVSADASRVSRWENSELDVPPAVVAAYEQLLGLPDASLQAAARGMYGALSPDLPAPPLYSLPAAESPRQAERRALRLADVAALGQPTGGQWCELVERLAGAGLLIIPDETARRLMQRLFSELGRSIGPAFVTRYEALRRLCTLPRFLPVALGQIEDLVHEPWSGVVIDIVVVLTDVPGSQANDLILRLVRDEDPERQYAALWSAATRVDRGDLAGVQLVQLEQALIALLAAGPPEPVQTVATDVIACMPLSAQRRVLEAVWGLPGNAGRRRAIEAGELIPAAAAAKASRAVARHVLRSVADDDAEDSMLSRVLREAMAHTSRDRRHQACVLLMVGPLRRPVADAVLALWDTLLPQCRVHAAMLLSYLADDSHLDELDQRVAADGPLELVRRSWMARAHLLRPVDDPGLLDRLRDAHPEVVKVALYALGMTGSAQLHEVAAQAFPEEVLGRSRWWINAGPAVRV
jgi:hypothetical protein